MKPPYFEAHGLEIGFCAVSTCNCVHIQLHDVAGNVRAQAVLKCEQIEAVISDLRAARDEILAGKAVH